MKGDSITLPGVDALRTHGSLLPPPEQSGLKQVIAAAVQHLRETCNVLWDVEMENEEIGFFNAEIWDTTQKINRIQTWYNKRYPV